MSFYTFFCNKIDSKFSIFPVRRLEYKSFGWLELLNK